VRLNYFSLGSNIGDRGHYLRTGVHDLCGHERFRLSPVYETAPWGGVEQDAFWNLVVELESDDSPAALLARAQEAERRAHRERLVHWGPRTLDVDVVLVGDLVVNTPDLIVPHPRMWERRFVLSPLRDLRPDLVTDDHLAKADGEVLRLGTLEEQH